MSDLSIRVDGLGKLYHLGKCSSYATLRENLMDVIRSPVRKFNSFISGASPATQSPPTAEESIWALKDVSFEVRNGEVLGIIGYNGAGKTTLLKILSRITHPTEGRAELHGRIGSLLEVGTGFHPELSGRENIYLNGAILGMKRVEIIHKLDEIVAFAEVEQFLDTPVKRYSTGMYVRLAFAVAAHMEPEILLVDEVLSVGDISFQKKCMARMSGIASEGRTILFVSHNLASILRLCSRGIWVKNGRLAMDGGIQEVVAAYQNHATKGDSSGAKKGTIRCVRRKKFADDLTLQSCVLLDDQGRQSYRVPYQAGCSVVIGALVNRSDIRRVTFHLWIESQGTSQSLIFLSSQETDTNKARVGDYAECVFHIHDLRLMPGMYQLSVGCKVGGSWTDVAYEVERFQIADDDVLHQEAASDYAPLRVDHEVETTILCPQ